HTVASATLASDGRIFTGINVYHCTSPSPLPPSLPFFLLLSPFSFPSFTKTAGELGSGGPCAENVMFANAVTAGVSSAMVPGILDAQGERVVLTHVVAVANDDRGVISPCGRCRQMMFDYYPDIKVIVKDDEGELTTVSPQELLPFAYDIKKIRKAGDPAKAGIV
ncbi:Blasticidin-S deaminase, partial [Lachnellula occidentalis]